MQLSKPVSNETLILDMIRRRGPISRADIAKLTGLTPPTVNTISGRLEMLDLIQTDRLGESSGGRRPVLMKVNPAREQIVVIHIRSYKMIGYVIDPALGIHYKHSSNIRGLGQQDVVDLLVGMVGECCKEATQEIVAIGVVARGPVRAKEGISVFAPNIGWRNMPLKYILEEKFRLPVFVENDAKALTNGEYYYGAAKNANNLLLLKVGYGIGCGLMFNGSLYRGVNNSAGEVGHMTLDMNGPRCSCGKQGCLEALASESALVEFMSEALRGGATSLVSEILEGEIAQLTADEIYQAAEAGDPLACKILKKVAHHLGLGIANMVNALNPELIVISGGLAVAQKFIEQQLQETVNEHSFESCSSVLEIRYSNETAIHTAKGMADMVLAEIADSAWLSQR
ncbi:ROK family transcriptional regulator [Azotosporobacter soli]|uniref:ROK family transcriptional regulator n=1 Tax=Azotosporobacter soli TaxID=3055040 RepID=UPI0031FE811C